MPYLAANLSAAPEALLRRLFEATNVTMRLTDGGNHMACSIRHSSGSGLSLQYR